MEAHRRTCGTTYSRHERCCMSWRTPYIQWLPSLHIGLPCLKGEYTPEEKATAHLDKRREDRRQDENEHGDVVSFGAAVLWACEDGLREVKIDATQSSLWSRAGRSNLALGCLCPLPILPTLTPIPLTIFAPIAWRTKALCRHRRPATKAYNLNTVFGVPWLSAGWDQHSLARVPSTATVHCLLKCFSPWLTSPYSTQFDLPEPPKNDASLQKDPRVIHIFCSDSHILHWIACYHHPISPTTVNCGTICERTSSFANDGLSARVNNCGRQQHRRPDLRAGPSQYTVPQHHDHQTTDDRIIAFANPSRPFCMHVSAWHNDSNALSRVVLIPFLSFIAAIASPPPWFEPNTRSFGLIHQKRKAISRGRCPCAANNVFFNKSSGFSFHLVVNTHDEPFRDILTKTAVYLTTPYSCSKLHWFRHAVRRIAPVRSVRGSSPPRSRGMRQHSMRAGPTMSSTTCLSKYFRRARHLSGAFYKLAPPAWHKVSQPPCFFKLTVQGTVQQSILHPNC